MERTPSDPNRALTIQLLEWIARKPRTLSETLDAWRTSCPRLSIWEDACIEGLIDHEGRPAGIVSLSDKGKEVLAARPVSRS